MGNSISKEEMDNVQVCRVFHKYKGYIQALIVVDVPGQ